MSELEPGAPERAVPVAARGAIHDLGYKRYTGARRSQRSRSLVIVRDVVAGAWRGWWRMKTWLLGALLTMVVAGAFMYFFRERIVQELAGRGFQALLGDVVIPGAMPWFLRCAFVLTLTVAAGLVAQDLRAGGFEFYFSRSVRPIDYVLGKVGGVFVVLWLAIGAGPLLLSLFRLGLASDAAEMGRLLPLVPKTLALGRAATLAYATVPLGFGALASRSRNALIGWAAWYLIGGTIALGVAYGAGVPAIAALDLPMAVTALTFDVYGIPPFGAAPEVPRWAALASLAGYGALGFALLYWRVARAAGAGIGGRS